MSTLAEIENAAEALPLEQKQGLGVLGIETIEQM